MNNLDQDEIISKILRIVSFLPLMVISMGVLGNTACFLIFRLSKEFNKIPSMVYLSFIAVFDTLSLFEWNLNHFLRPNFKIEIEFLSLFNCRFFVFIQYFSLQSSASLLSIMCVDRFITIISTPGSFVSRLPFSTNKSAFVWCSCVSIILFLTNIHILILNGYYDPPVVVNATSVEVINGTFINTTNTVLIYSLDNHCYLYETQFSLAPTWDGVHLFIYSIIPFIIMFIFNILLISKTLITNKSSMKKSKEALKSMRKKRKLTISILVITFGFIVMTMPVSFVFTFVRGPIEALKYGRIILDLLNFISFSFHASLFSTCFMSNIKLRNFVGKKLCLCYKKRRSQILNLTKSFSTI